MLPDAKYYAKKRYEEMQKQKEDAKFRESLAYSSSGNQTYEDNVAYRPSHYREIAAILKNMRDKD